MFEVAAGRRSMSRRMRSPLPGEATRRPLPPGGLVARSAPGALAARNATGTTPIGIASVQAPVALGLAVSMARPGGNVTGFWAEGDDSLIGKRLELLKDAVPGTSRL